MCVRFTPIKADVIDETTSDNRLSFKILTSFWRTNEEMKWNLVGNAVLTQSA